MNAHPVTALSADMLAQQHQMDVTNITCLNQKMLLVKLPSLGYALRMPS